MKRKIRNEFAKPRKIRGFLIFDKKYSMANYIFNFSCATDAETLEALNEIYSTTGPFYYFHKAVVEYMGPVDKKTLEREFIIAVNSEHLFEDYKLAIRQIKLFPYWKFKISPSHPLDGLILNADDLRWGKILPPIAFIQYGYICLRMSSEVEDVDFEAMSVRLDNYLKTEEYQKELITGFIIPRNLPQKTSQK